VLIVQATRLSSLVPAFEAGAPRVLVSEVLVRRAAHLTLPLHRPVVLVVRHCSIVPLYVVRRTS
jgi:hypothetical protein